MTTTGIDERRTNTREQIRVIAIELFAERGYDKTSLREIAERLGVTKAAVYYHFRTKEEIVTSLFDDQIAGMDAVVVWGESQPPGAARRRGLVERYHAMLMGATVNTNIVKFIQENQSAFKGLAAGERVRERFSRLAALLAAPDAPVTELLRMRLALIAMHFGAFASDELPGSHEERAAAGLEVALELIRCSSED